MRPTQWARIALASILVVVVVLIPIVIWQLVSNRAAKHEIAWAVAAIFVLIAVPLSIYDVAAHLMRYAKPELQRYVVRILWMVPIYSVESWLALRFKSKTTVLETARECYEAYVIYCFYKLMERWLGTTKMIQDKLRAKPQKTVHHIPPMCCLPRWKLTTTFIRQCRFGVFQYVLIRVILTLVTFVLVWCDKYGEGEFLDFSVGYPYIAFIENLSQCWAMYCLVIFYHTLEKELHGLRPLPKLLSVKMLVFVTFWQSVVVAGLAKIGVIKGTLSYTQDDVSYGLQDFLICIEMALCAVAHHYYFSWRDFAPEDSETPLAKGVLDILPFDMFQDAKTHLLPGSKKRRGSVASTDSTVSGEYDFVPMAPPTSAMYSEEAAAQPLPPMQAGPPAPPDPVF